MALLEINMSMSMSMSLLDSYPKMIELSTSFYAGMSVTSRHYE